MFPSNLTQYHEFLINVGNDVGRTSQFMANYIPTKLVILNLKKSKKILPSFIEIRNPEN